VPKRGYHFILALFVAMGSLYAAACAFRVKPIVCSLRLAKGLVVVARGPA
jgi:hypothetical protein